MRTSPIRARWILLQGVMTLAAVATPAAGAGSIVYVDDDAQAGGDGSSWNTAYRFLQDAIASPAAEIRVAQGTYVPDRNAANPDGTGNRAATFQLSSGVAILGGFAGIGSPDPDARDIVQFTTILSGDLDGDDGPPGSFTNNAENSRNVVTTDGTDLSAVLDGCTVTAGNASNDDGELHRARGGGIWNGTGSPTVRDCRIEYNAALLRGGGMYNFTDTNPVVTGCTFTGNRTSAMEGGHGGGLRNYESNATVTDCVFVGNSSPTGGGMDNSYGSAVVTGCVFTGNSALYGGGMSNLGGSDVTVTDCTFTGNLAGSGGGIYGGVDLLTGSTFCDNSPNHISGGWSDGGGNAFCPLCDAAAGPTLEVPADYPTIQSAINAACDDGTEILVSPGTYCERITFGGKALVLRSTHGPQETTIDAEGTGPVVLLISGEGVGTTIEGFTLANGAADMGGGARIIDGTAAIIDCHFRDNVAQIGGAIRIDAGAGVGGLNLLRCVFDGNRALISSGAIFSAAADGLVAVDCVFTDNDGGQGPGAAGSSISSNYINCVFAGNTAGFVAGGLAAGGNNDSIVNCVFTRNAALMSGGMDGGGESSGAVTNCTFSLNQGGGVGYVSPLSNCILWGNVPEQIGNPSQIVAHSDVQGGWQGTGNIDADPMFVQPGIDDVRLAFGSPCVNAGNDAALPPDTFDLDGDGDTAEPIPFDAGGQPRVQDGVVDMGAWEGEFEAGPPASSASNLDQGGFVVLVPGGAPFNPLQTPAAFVTNISGADNATVVVVQIDLDLHPGAGGFSELGTIFQLGTDMADGEYRATIFIPFDAATMADAEPTQMNLARFDEEMGNWSFASSANTVVSPGFIGPIGNRIAAVQGGAWGLSQEIGDYGVYWDPQTQLGFVWAIVDREAEFGVGTALCPTDCLQTPDGSIGIQDLLVLLSRWGAAAGGGPCDANDDAVIDGLDFAALLGAWGPCQAASAAAPHPGSGQAGAAAARRTTRSPDLDANGFIDATDLEALRSAWGRCVDCAADLDGNGRVDVRDMLSQLRDWAPRSLR